ncbi:amino acid permease [Streptomyces sp. NPDC002523]
MLTDAAQAMATPDAVDHDLFESAVATPDAQRWPFEWARICLAYGERLRRARAVNAARAHLDAALDTFLRLGAEPWSARAANELRASGIPVPTAAPGENRTARLTPQEVESAGSRHIGGIANGGDTAAISGRNRASLISVARQESFQGTPPRQGTAMTVTTDPTPSAPPPAGVTDDGSLASFGYGQELRRQMGRFASFAAGFSFISVLTTVFQFFSLGYSFGGPLFLWTWPAVLVGQLLVAACFAELAARYPISGAIYQWSTRLSSPVFGWYTGWIMVVGQVVVVAAAALALQVVLPPVWSGFQLVGGDPAPTTATGAANAALLALVLLVLTTVVNVLDNRVMSAVNRVGVTAEITGAILIVVLLFTHVERGAGVTLRTGGEGGPVAALLVGSFTAAYVLIGFDSAGEMSEETRSPRRTAPRTILSALASAGVLGGLLLLGGLLAAPSLSDGRLATEGLSYVLTSSLGDGVGKVLLADVAVAVVVATLAIQTAGTRMLFSMARDGMLPFSAQLAKVSKRTGMPFVPALVVGALAAALALLNLASPEAFLAIGTTCIAMLYLAYAGVTVPMLVRRLRGQWPTTSAGDHDELGRPLFSLGRWGLPVNVLAVGYGVFMTVNLAWPRAEVYDPAGGHWYFQWFTVLFVGATIAVGAVYRLGGGAVPVAKGSRGAGEAEPEAVRA